MPEHLEFGLLGLAELVDCVATMPPKKAMKVVKPAKLPMKGPMKSIAKLKAMAQRGKELGEKIKDVRQLVEDSQPAGDPLNRVRSGWRYECMWCHTTAIIKATKESHLLSPMLGAVAAAQG